MGLDNFKNLLKRKFVGLNFNADQNHLTDFGPKKGGGFGFENLFVGLRNLCCFIKIFKFIKVSVP